MSPQPPCLKQREASTVGGGVGRPELEDKRGRQNNKHLFLASFLEVALHIREKKSPIKNFWKRLAQVNIHSHIHCTVNKNWPSHLNKHDMISFLIKDLKGHATQTETLASEWKPVKKVCERDFWLTFERRC